MFLNVIKKYKKTFAILVIVVLYLLSWLISFDNNRSFRYGVTFSQSYAQYLGLDWREVLTATLDDLQIQNYRLIAYWNLIEPGPGIYNFSDLDWQISEVEKRGGNVILSLGLRVPRWPECHIPSWALNLTEEQIMAVNNKYIEAVVKHYSNNKTIVAWQVENEPFLRVFGQCQKQTAAIVMQKVETTKKISKLPVAITDSGELGNWWSTAKIADWLGVSVYRRVRQPVIGYINYPLPPVFYSLRAGLIRLFQPNKNIYISELQLEPWINGGLIDASLTQQQQAMSEKNVSDFIIYARRTGLDPIYFWGVEWWYYMKQKGIDSYWQIIKSQIIDNAGKI